MDKSVAQKFMIVMSLLTAMFATVFVCGSIVSSSVSSDSYVQPLPKIRYVVTYSDTSIYETSDNEISESDVHIQQEKTTATDSSNDEHTKIENGVTVVEFIDDDEEEDYTSETMNVPEEDIDEQFLYMTTVTTKLPVASVEKTRTTTTVKNTTTTTRKTTKKTTKKTTAVTSAKPYTSRSTTTTRKSTVRTTPVKTSKTTKVSTTTTTKKITSTESSVSVVTSTTSKTTVSTTSPTTSTTTTTTTHTTTSTTTTTAKPTTTTTTQKPTTTEKPTTTSKSPQIGGAVSINKRTTTESTAASEQP
ncbi:MAG: hypothetical protein IIZ08_07825 [Clostridia bacterium]|nr:hypothetical protein [Clostridia bacterium]